MTPEEALQYVVASIGLPGSNDAAIFEAEEVSDWGNTALRSLVAAGLLMRIQPASVITCRGCEQRCRRPVIRLPAKNSAPARRYIVCPVYDEIAPMPVKSSALARWRSSMPMLAAFVAEFLNLPKLEPAKRVGEAYVGQTAGLRGRRKFRLVNDGKVMLQAGGTKVALSDVISWREGSPIVHVEDVWALVTDESGSCTEKGYEPQKIRQAANRLERQKRDGRIIKEARQLKRAHPKWNRKRIGAELAKQSYAVRTSGQHKSLSAGRVVRILSGKI